VAGKASDLALLLHLRQDGFFNNLLGRKNPHLQRKRAEQSYKVFTTWQTVPIPSNHMAVHPRMVGQRVTRAVADLRNGNL
jgi:hypothetical protein